MNASARPLGDAASMPRSRISAAEELLVEPVLVRAGSGSARAAARSSGCDAPRSSGHEDVRAAEVAVVLRDLVLEDQVVAERVPGQLADEPVVLVEVVPRVREDEVRATRGAFSSSKTSFTSPPTYGRNPSRKSWTHDLASRRRRRGTRPRSARASSRALAGRAEHDPVDLELGLRASQREQRPAAADLDVVGVGAERRRTLRSGPRRPPRARARALACRPESRSTLRQGARPDSSMLVEPLLVLDRVHRRPEALVADRRAARSRSIRRAERLVDELLARARCSRRSRGGRRSSRR